MSTDKLEAIAGAVADYRRVEQEQRQALRELAAEAEKNDYYGDYDEACYDTWESLMNEGSALAAEIETILGKA